MRDWKIARVAVIMLIILAVGFGGLALYKYMEEQNAGSEYEEIKKEVVITPTPTPEVTPLPTEEEGPEVTPVKEPVVIPIDFAKLQERNPDAYAWITIPGTVIDYPILQSATDNNYYLKHTIDGKTRSGGSIYTENYNSKDFEDPNTIIYGHNMRNGSMFKGLHKYADRSFFDENREIIIYMPDKILHYKIFAAYLYDDRHILMSFPFDNMAIYEYYINSIFKIRDMSACIDTSMEVDSRDKIITLSTCYAGDSTKRYLVQAVLESVET